MIAMNTITSLKALASNEATDSMMPTRIAAAAAAG